MTYGLPPVARLSLTMTEAVAFGSEPRSPTPAIRSRLPTSDGDATCGRLGRDFQRHVNGDTANTRTLTVNASGATTFTGAVGTATTGQLSALTTDEFGTTAINGGAIKATTQTFKDDVTISNSAGTTLTGTTVAFEKTLNSATTTTRSITVNASGATTFGGVVGGVDVLSGLLTDTSGTTTIKGGAVSATTMDFKEGD